MRSLSIRPLPRPLRGLLVVLLVLASAGVGAVDPAPTTSVRESSSPAHIRVLANRSYPPFLFVDGDGKPQGYEVQLWKLFQQHTGIRVELVPVDWASARKELESERADVLSPIYPTPSRQAFYDFTSPDTTVSASIYVDHRIHGVRDIAGLRGFRVGVADGDGCTEQLHAFGFTDLVSYRTHEDLARGAARGDARIFCMDDRAASYYLLNKHQALERYIPAFGVLQGQMRHAVRKGNSAMLATVERGMALITPEERARLNARWLDYPAVQRPYLRAASIAAALVVFLTVLLALWIWSLRRNVSRRTGELQAEKGKLRALFDASPDAMWVKSCEGVYLECNDHALDLLSVTRVQLIGHTDEELFGPERAAELRAVSEEVTRLGIHRTQVVKFEGGTGPVRRYEILNAPRYSHGTTQVHGVISAARDITQRLDTEARLRLWGHAFRHAHFSMVIFDARRHRILAANPAFAQERGYTADAMSGMSVEVLYPPDLLETRAAARKLIDQQDHTLQRTEHVTRDGRRFPVLLDCSVSHDAEGQADYVVAHVQDITEHERMLHELRISATAFRTQAAMMVLGPDRIVQRVNDAFVALTGYAADEAIGQPAALLRPLQHDVPDSASWDHARSHGVWQGEEWIAVKTGKRRVVRTLLSAVADDAGLLSHYVCSMIDLTDEREAREHAERMTFFDALTELPNKHFVKGRIQDLLATKDTSAGILLLFNLDHFKRVNELHGHAAGDVLLKLLALRLRHELLDDGFVLSRCGGDTFAVLMDVPAAEAATAPNSALPCVERLRKALRKPFELEASAPVTLTASFGWTRINPVHASADAVFQEAELALYSAKCAGRDSACPFAPTMHGELERRETLVRELRHAIANDGLELHLQPQVDLHGAVIGAEALARWTRPCGECVPPDVFIAIAEDNGLITALGDWVLRRGCSYLAAWAKEPLTQELSIALNVSAQQFSHPTFVESVRAVLTASAVDPSRLELEITETSVLVDIGAAATKLKELRNIGTRISLDDFGTGYSSLSYLAQLPLDQLKIDQSFVRRVPDDPKGVALVETIIEMGRRLGLEVIAEGVETQEQRRFLVSRGCDALQGYLFSKPMSQLAFVAMLDGTCDLRRLRQHG